MISESATRTVPAAVSVQTLDQGVRDGVIDGAARDALMAMEVGRIQAGTAAERSTLDPARTELRPTVDPENPRFIGGFGDLFVGIGIVLVLGGLGITTLAGANALAPAAIVNAAASWGLAELFTRHRRQAFPSILLLLFFVGSILALAWGLVAASGTEPFDIVAGSAAWMTDATWTERLLVVLAAVKPVPLATMVAAGLIAAWLHYRRFGVPITVMVAALTVIAALVGFLVRAAPETVLTHITQLSFLSGLGLFLLAMRYDLSDPERATRRADIAFWLHLVAAPLMVRAILPVGPMGVGEASLVIGLFALIAVVSMVIDRRAPLVAGLASFGFAMAALMSPAVREGGTTIILVLGIMILAFAYAWQPIRRAVLGILPPRLASRLPRPVDERLR